MIVGGLVIYAAINFHLVRARDGFHVVAKQPPRMAGAYIDIRKFSISDWAGHPELTAALLQANQRQLLGEAANTAVSNGADQVLPSWPTSSATP